MRRSHSSEYSTTTRRNGSSSHNELIKKFESSQPKPQKEEKELAVQYSAIDDVGGRAFAILVDLDLGMVIVSPDPRSPNFDASQDDEFVEYKG
jgi:hypothetical protein